MLNIGGVLSLSVSIWLNIQLFDAVKGFGMLLHIIFGPVRDYKPAAEVESWRLSILIRLVSPKSSSASVF
jgi:hypothetical protein